MPVVVAAPDKFRGTATAAEVAGAIARAAHTAGWDAVLCPLSDGGEGLLEACAGVCPEAEVTMVTGPAGSPVQAEWRHGDGLAVVEMARASGLTLAGGPTVNDPVAATSRGTGELVAEAARRVGSGGTVVLGLGGSATTDGGEGAIEAVEQAGGLDGVTLIGACDVDVVFVEAARMFGPQKGAGRGQVTRLTRRLEMLADRWTADLGIDVRSVAGGGAAGGLGAAVVVLGGRLESGYRLVASLVGLTDVLATADAVVTGEGALDAGSLAGKVVGGVIGDARRFGVAALVVAGQASAVGRGGVAGPDTYVVALSDRFGRERAMTDTLPCIEDVTAEWLTARGPVPS